MTNTPTTFFGWIIFLIQQYHGYYLQGLLTTLETSLAGTICGCFLGFLVGIIQATDIRAQDNMIKKILLGIPWVSAFDRPGAGGHQPPHPGDHCPLCGSQGEPGASR